MTKKFKLCRIELLNNSSLFSNPTFLCIFYSYLFFLFQYEARVAENKVDALIIKMTVTDGDEAHSPAWNAKFKIVDGDPGKLFTVKTGSNKNEGIITTAKVGI